MSSDAGPWRNASACSTSSKTISGCSRSSPDAAAGRPIALEFLLQTLAALDIATRGFLDGTRRYEQERARAEDLAHRDTFRNALVNSLQEGFFVADHDGAVIEMNSAFAEIIGYPRKACRTAGRIRGCSTRKARPSNSSGFGGTASPSTRRRSGIATAIWSG